MSVKAFLFEVVGLLLSSCSGAPASARRFGAEFEWPVSSEHLPAPPVVALSWAGVSQKQNCSLGKQVMLLLELPFM